ncbi:DUF732 domain-containing protein [Streptomyces luteireticuli]|uniref:DUF732 domain-containing protein n=1 Tax=Streptomyces luteireticuli TaxID=173858 RepID=A0ABN0YPQ2_9ACTN
MRQRIVVLCTVLLAGLVACAPGSPDADEAASASADKRPTVADFIGKTKRDAHSALSGTGTAFGFRDKTSQDRSGAQYDSWIVCKQDASREPVWFTVAASRQECGLPEAKPSRGGQAGATESSQPTSSAQSADADKDSRYTAAVKAQAPKLAYVEAGNLGVQGRLICTLLDSGDSPEEVFETTQGGYPEETARVMVTEAPAVYCPQHAAAVDKAFK